MSVQAIAWALEQRVGHANAKLVLLSLANRAGFDNTCFPSAKTLAGESELSVRSIHYALNHLIDLKLISREKRSRADGTRTTSQYLLHIAPIQLQTVQGTMHVHDSQLQLRAHHEPSLEPSKRDLESGRKQAKGLGFHILIDTPQWKAWCKYLKTTPPLDKRFGWTFDSEWPPGHLEKAGRAA